jgi:hypothetical protein
LLTSVSDAFPLSASATSESISHSRPGPGRTWIIAPEYEISGKQVVVEWSTIGKSNRERPIMGDRRPPSPLCDIQPDYWLAEYTTELINPLNVLGMLLDLEPRQADLLEKICAGRLISADELDTSGALIIPAKAKVKVAKTRDRSLFADDY